MSRLPQPTDPQRAGPKSTGSNFRQRLGYYLVGVAIGCLMAGVIYAQRKAARQQLQQPPQQQQQPQQAPQVTPPVPTPVTTPVTTPPASSPR